MKLCFTFEECVKQKISESTYLHLHLLLDSVYLKDSCKPLKVRFGKSLVSLAAAAAAAAPFLVARGL